MTSLVLAALLAGCGGAEVSSKAADTPADLAAPEPTSLTDEDSALLELDRAEGQLSALFGPSPAAPSEAVSPGASPPPAEPTVAEPVAQAAQGAPADGRAEAQSSSDPCAIACRALSSMERAADHLCGLSGPEEPSCTSARQRVKNATSRVAAHCSCGR